MDITTPRQGLPAGDAFTRALSAGAPARSVSALLATYNRCPFDPAAGRLRDNPLTWALDSLRGQAGDALAEIVVVDDGSTDHTSAVLEQYQGTPGAPVRAYRLPAHRGAFAARNTAAQIARGRWLLFGDDDCVFGPHYAVGAAHVLHALQQIDPCVGAVMLPFYYRSVRPHETAAVGRIGRLDADRAEFATRFHTWPAEYGGDPPRLPGVAGVVAPLPVQLIGGTALIDADALRRAGGFVDMSAWTSSYADHLHLSADLTDTGAHLYHCPDPRLSAVHLKFGAIGRYRLDPMELDAPLPALDRPLRDLVDLAARPRSDTGCRVSDEAFHPEMIGSFFAFFAGRSLRGAATWALRIWRDFVEAGQVYTLAVSAAPPPQAARAQAWRDGLARGARSLVNGVRPGRPADVVQSLLDEACAAVGQAPIRNWS
ncbi:glycosyltransferase family 2 protein [Micromonospora sp. CPCC 206061]|uniref:glycosyltransferase family 2 protein n=1 Tax=Micromonospora sp. CPCC 206061 TaxID=3122410 RepID=UPI002FF2B54E